MADSDNWSYLSASANPLPSRRQQPREYSVPDNSGYPNKIANTQTLRTRGTKNTTRGNSSGTKMG